MTDFHGWSDGVTVQEFFDLINLVRDTADCAAMLAAAKRLQAVILENLKYSPNYTVGDYLWQIRHMLKTTDESAKGRRLADSILTSHLRPLQKLREWALDHAAERENNASSRMPHRRGTRP
jgi:hypothetical protein